VAATAPADPQIHMEAMLRLLFAESAALDELAAGRRALAYPHRRPQPPQLGEHSRAARSDAAYRGR